ncbi:MAG: hypothetical protein VX737_05525 [Pseudomonadota bacterium]|nr:hypothetical protein [Pseudomonadota bacterium]
MSRYLSICLVGLLVLSGCSNMTAVSSKKHSQTTKINRVMSASPNTNIYLDIEAHTRQAIWLKDSIKVKNDVNSSRIPPYLYIKKSTLLVFDRETSEYDYYVTKKTPETVGEMVKLVTLPGTGGSRHSEAIQGLKISKKSNRIQGFVINGYGEYTYEVPKNISWEKTQTVVHNKKGSSERIDYLGIKNNNLQFRYRITEPFGPVTVALGAPKSGSHEKIISIPIDKKTFNIGKHHIEILSIKGSTITYKITS